MRHKGLAPVVDKNTRVLILGSFPGGESLRLQKYYAHKQNQFWRILGDVIGEELENIDYDKRKKIVLSHNIGIWDVYDSCYRKGSLDSAIKRPKINDFKSLPCEPEFICFNGKEAGKHAHLVDASHKIVLPSTSPANTMKYEKKLREWKKIRTFID